MSIDDDTFSVESTWGYLLASCATGIVVDHCLTPDIDEQTCYLENIHRFDIDEWKETYSKSKLVSSIDILDLGYWMIEGEYCPSEPSCREIIKSILQYQSSIKSPNPR